mgnify:CR=1 FL=1
MNMSMDTGHSLGILARTMAGAVLGSLALAAPPALAGQAVPHSSVTFSKDVAPILQRACQNCHRPGGGAPMALLSFEDARPWARAIKLRTTNREMPPWFIEKNVGIQKFKDDISLTDHEISTIAKWVDAGSPQGNPADMPAARQFPSGTAWTIGTPDLIVSSPEMTVKAVAPDWHGFVPTTPSGLTEDRYVKSVEVREIRIKEQPDEPGKPRAAMGYSVIHHAGISTGSGMREDDTAEGRSLNGFAITHEAGQNATSYPNELGVVLPANSKIHWRMHTHAFGREVVVRLDVAFRFHPKGFKPKYELKTTAIGGDLSNHDLDIPAGEANARFDAVGIVQQPTKLVTFEPHMHAGGKRMCVQVIYPTGVRETLNCAGYNHSWIKVYQYADETAPLLPKGTFVHVIGWYDNTPANPRVTDPRNWKGFGSRSIDDMMFFLGRFVPLTDEQFAEEVAARKAAKQRPGRSTQNQ